MSAPTKLIKLNVEDISALLQKSTEVSVASVNLVVFLNEYVRNASNVAATLLFSTVLEDFGLLFPEKEDAT